MRIASKYILREHIGPFFFGLAIITFVLIMDFILDILNLIISKGLPAFVILEVFILNLAWMLALSIPMAVLVAVLMAFGSLSANNEITAFKSCGIPFHRLIIPVLLASTVLAVGLVWFNDRVLPNANHKARVLMSDITRKKPAWNIEPGVFIDNFPGYSILIQKVNKDRINVKGITIYDKKDRATPRTIVAKKGKIYFIAGQTTLKIELEDGEIHEQDKDDPSKYHRLKFEHQTIYIPNAGSKLVRSDSEYRGDREQNISMMKAENIKTEKKIAKAYDNLLTNIQQTFKLISPLKKVLKSKIKQPRDISFAVRTVYNEIKKISKQARYEKQNIDSFRRRHNSMSVEIQKKFSIPVACIVFVLLGGPLGVMARRGGMGTGLGLSLLFFVLYWAFLIGGEELADREIISPFLAMWSANIILGTTGIYLLIRSVRESAFLNIDLSRLMPFSSKSKSGGEDK